MAKLPNQMEAHTHTHTHTHTNGNQYTHINLFRSVQNAESAAVANLELFATTVWLWGIYLSSMGYQDICSLLYFEVEMFLLVRILLLRRSPLFFPHHLLRQAGVACTLALTHGALFLELGSEIISFWRRRKKGGAHRNVEACQCERQKKRSLCRQAPTHAGMQRSLIFSVPSFPDFSGTATLPPASSFPVTIDMLHCVLSLRWANNRIVESAQ